MTIRELRDLYAKSAAERWAVTMWEGEPINTFVSQLSRVLAMVEAVGAIVNEADPQRPKTAQQLDEMASAYRELEKHGDIGPSSPDKPRP